VPFFKLIYLQFISIITWWSLTDNYKTGVEAIHHIDLKAYTNILKEYTAFLFRFIWEGMPVGICRQVARKITHMSGRETRPNAGCRHQGHICAQDTIRWHKGYTCTRFIFNDTWRNTVFSPQQMKCWYGDISSIYYTVWSNTMFSSR
jgi:hypothetical protein